MTDNQNRFRGSMPREQFDQLPGTEIKEKRSRYSKVFALGGNRFQAVTYTDPIHRYNEQTRTWEELDNRFTATSRMESAKAARKQGLMPAMVQSDALLTCKTGSMDVECAMSGEAPFITLTDREGHKLSWGIEGASSILPETDEVSDVAVENVRSLRENVLNRLHGEVVYNDIFNGTTLRCKLDRGFKDEVIFRDRESVRPVTFLLESAGGAMELTDQGGLVVKVGQQIAFRLQAPQMVDAEGQQGKASVQLAPRAAGMYALTYTPDEAFVSGAAFPVTLDPAVETTSEEGGIVDTYVEKNYYDNRSALDRLWICDDATRGTCNAYMKVARLPALGANHYITSAYLCVKNYAALSTETTLVMSEVLEDWDASTITYANQPRHNALYQDCCRFPKKNANYSWLSYVWRELDVTSLARKWYLGENHGVVFTPAPSDAKAIALNSSEGSSKPYFVLNYASLAGLESYLTYDGQNGGLAGQGAVSLANGNLVFAHGDTAMNGQRMPVSVTHYYNSCDADKDPFGLGLGWRTSLHQTLHKEYLNSKVMYVYTDGDGTEHWFEPDEESSTQSGTKKEEVKYVDLSGLSLTLTVASDGVITITDKGDQRLVFPAISKTPNASAPVTDKVLVTSIHDAVGNQITVTPVTGHPLQIASVTDGAGRVTTFRYANHLCSAILTPWQTDTTCTRFTYTNGQLTGVTHEDGRTSSYTYEVRNGYALLTQTSGQDGVKVTYDYSNTGAVDGLPYCVVSTKCTGSQDGTTLTAGDVTYTYGNHMALVKDNLSGKTLRYHLNDNGNQVSIDDELGYAVYTRYDQTGDNAQAPINHATTRSRMQRVVKNLLEDSMFERNSSAWEKSSSGVTRDVSTFQWGVVSWRLAATSAGTYLRQNAWLTPGKSYTFSGYLRSSAKNTFLRVSYTVQGKTVLADSDPVKVWDNPSNKPYERVSVSFTLPANADAQVKCAVMCMGSSGSGWASCMQLEEGLTCNPFNMLQDQNFSGVSSSTEAAPQWHVGTDTLSAYVSARSLTNCQVKPPAVLTGRALHLQAHYDPNYNLCIDQELKVSGSAGDRFTVGGWASTFAKAQDESAGVYCCVDVLFPSGSYWLSGGQAVFNYEEGNWQFACAGVVAPVRYDKIRVRVNMSQQMNFADVTGLFLYAEAFGTEYVYDKNGNRQHLTKLYGAIESAEYDDEDNLIRYTAPGHTKSTTLSYGTGTTEQKKHLLRKSVSPLGTVSQFSYDSFGNATQTDVSGSEESATALIRSKTSYTADGNYPTTQTDARGKTVTTVTDPDKGTASSVTDPKGQRVDYAYDALRRVVKVSSAAGEATYRNEYSYNEKTGQLETVSHNTSGDSTEDVKYTFTYDALGRKVRVQVGETTLSEEEYQNDPAKPNYGTLTKQTYGNGDAVRNQYDDFNRVTGVIYGEETEPRYEYDYNAKGQVAHVRNRLLNRVTESEYDLANRPCRIKTHEEDGTHVYTGEVAYDDAFGTLVEFKEKVGSGRTEYTTTFGYDEENRPTNLSYGGYGQSTLTYDKLGRVKQSSVKAGSGTAMTTTYAFVEGGHGTNSTTGLVKSISQAGGNFTYTYDDNGNIVSVVQDGKKTAYTYDALGQLIRVDDQQENATWVYTYDQGGNILSKKKYAYGVTTGEPAESKTFTYGNAKWKDQLTAVDGTPITYDAIGNPLNDGTWTYTWQNGRQLASMSKSGTTASFKYNENGLRVQKTVNGVTTDYTLHGKNIVHMKQGSNNLHFFYDAQNCPAVVVYNGTAYSYAKSLQGDIVAILNNTGTAVVQYVYDAWGRPISCTGTMATTLGKLNPFRYRGYVYDEETILYYLRSRYYSPLHNRFVNADSLICGNLFSYCNNAPVLLADANGQSLHLATSEFGGGGCGYISPSERQPNAIFDIDARGENTGHIPVSYFLACLDQMYKSGKFIYPLTKTSANEYYVDCIGMIRTAFRPYSEGLFANCAKAVYGMEKASRFAGCPTEIVAGNEENLVPGMAIYWCNTKAKDEKKRWPHIGIYFGEYYDSVEGKYYTDAVVQSASGSYMRMVVRSMADIQNDFANKRAFDGYVLKYGMLKYVDYDQ